MSDEKQVNSDDLIKYVVGEVHLLYYLEKEVLEIKKNMEKFLVLQRELEEIKEKRMKMEGTLRKIRRIAMCVIVIALIGGALFTLISCDALFPDLESIIDEERSMIEDTSWLASGEAPYVSLEFSQDGASCTAIDEYNIPFDGIVIGDTLVINDISYAFVRSGNTLTLQEGSTTYTYVLSIP